MKSIQFLPEVEFPPPPPINTNDTHPDIARGPTHTFEIREISVIDTDFELQPKGFRLYTKFRGGNCLAPIDFKTIDDATRWAEAFVKGEAPGTVKASPVIKRMEFNGAEWGITEGLSA